MSASERLAALEVGDGLTPYILEDARDEIAAVVRAAEREAPFEERGGNTGDLRRALAALDEKLTTGGE